MGNEWSAEITVRAARGTTFTDDTAIDLADALRDADPVIAFSRDELTVAFTIQADDPLTATYRTFERASEAAAKIGAGDLPTLFARITVQTFDELARRVDEPNVPELVGVAEIGRMLGVTKQRVSELSRADWFPDPLVELAAGPVWARTSIEKFRRGWPRKPGRPKSAAKAVR